MSGFRHMLAALFYLFDKSLGFAQSRKANMS
jgi:hypothetical protein